MMDLMRHVDAATALRLPGPYARLRLAGACIGYLTPQAESVLRAAGLGLDLPDAACLGHAAAALREAGLWRPRGEDFDVRAAPDGPALARVDRGALPVLGISAEGAHVNGLVERRDGWHIWIGTRAPDRTLDPGKLDHLVGGGISAGMTAAETLVKEAGEEAGIAPALARHARPAGQIAYTLLRPEGLRRDRLHCYDLVLPADFVPVSADGEMTGFTLLPAGTVLARVRDTEDFKFNVSLVLIALFARLGMAEAEAPAARLRALGACYEA